MGVNWPRKAVRSPGAASAETGRGPASVVKNAGSAGSDGEGEEDASSEYETSEEEEEPIEDVGSDYAPSDGEAGVSKSGEVSSVFRRVSS